MEKVTVDYGYWQGRGIALHSIGAEPGRHVQVDIDNPERDARKIRARHPHMALPVGQGSPSTFATTG